MATYLTNYYRITVEGTAYTYCFEQNHSMAQVATWLAEKIQAKTTYTAYAHGEQVYVDVPANVTLSITGFWYYYYHH